MILTITHEEVLKAVKNYVENSGTFDVNNVDIKVRRGSKVEALVEFNIQDETVELNKEQGE